MNVGYVYWLKPSKYLEDIANMCISHYFAHPELCTFPEVASSSDWEEGQHLGIIVTTTNAMAQAMAAE